jgi:proline racemase
VIGTGDFRQVPPMTGFPHRVRVVDSHTEGEATRVVLDGWPQPEGATMHERREFMRNNQDTLRRGLILEPRGFPAMVGALLTPPVSADSQAGVVFFNNIGYLGMCGHGLMGVARTLQHLGRLSDESVRIDTPVGTVFAQVSPDGPIEIENVASFCYRIGVSVEVAPYGRIKGDIAYGGNWFFITEIPGINLDLRQVPELLALAERIGAELRENNITGQDGAEIDHIELSGRAMRIDADSRNFVLCPGGEYDRSPCGTGTSAKLASLHARGALLVGEHYRQESITGSLFEARLTERGGELVPRLRGRAFITAESTVVFEEGDPFKSGMEGK